jgi:glycine receptor
VYLTPGKVEYLGDKDLLQFTVSNFTISGLKNDTIIEVEFTLQRMVMFHLVNTYMPTVCIMIIVEITLFIDESHFDSNIMVALTGMLVMYTLYQSISLTLPPTAYLKLLDIWLIFSLVMPFLIFMVEVFWEIEMFHKKPKVDAVEKNSTWIAEEMKSLSKQKSSNKNASKTAVVGVTIIFSVTYVAYTIYVYNT